MQPKDSQKVLKRIEELRKKYTDDVIYYNYPGYLFYLDPSFTWLSTQSQAYFGCAPPYLVFFFKDGHCSFEHPTALGPGERVMERLKKEGLAVIEEIEKKAVRAEQEAKEWVNRHRVLSGKSLQEYIDLLQGSNRVFLENHIHFQIAIHLDKHLNAQLLKVFHVAKSHLDKEIFSMCISDKKSDATLHDEEVARLRDWCKECVIPLAPDFFEQNIGNHEFAERLKTCYDIGYFLHSGFGGVKLWTLKDEYEAIVVGTSKSQEALSHQQPPFTKEQELWVTIACYFSGLRDRRKSLQQRMYFYQAQLLEEIAKLINIPRPELEHLRVEQFTTELLKSPSARKMIEEQKVGYMIFWEPSLGFRVWVGDDAIHARALLESERTQEIAEIKGQVACHGKAKGRVRLVINPRLQKTFDEGDILVTGMTSPDFVPFMKKAAAIVTDIGGITCHAAIIARELGKPCVIGTKIATKVLKDGDLVEVDADKGIVRKLR